MNKSTVLSQVLFILGVVSFIEPQANQRISIMYSKRSPFVMQSGSAPPKGMDVSIIENFARKFNLQIDYVQSNESLNSAFFSANDYDGFKRSKTIK